MQTHLHFVTGKGGVGKSTVAAALARQLVQSGQGPVLILDVQGSGRALQLHGLDKLPFANTRLPLLDGAWGARLLPRDTFRQYFGLLLSLGGETSSFAQFTQGIRGRVVDMVLENRVVSAFVDVCPGLEPAVLMGKLHWEATEGRVPDSTQPWRHVIVDAPATGHGLMLFRSTFALLDVFSSGVILKQARQIQDFVRDAQRTHIHIVTTAEELPMQESVEMKKGFAAMGLKPHAFIVNRRPPRPVGKGGAAGASLNAASANASANASDEAWNTITDPVWRQEARLMADNWKEQWDLLEGFRARAEDTPVLELPEVARPDLREGVSILAAGLDGLNNLSGRNGDGARGTTQSGGNS